MAVGGPRTSAEAEDSITAQYHLLMQSGRYVASTTTLPTLWLLSILAFLMLDTRHLRHRRLLRLSAWLASAAVSAYNLMYVRAKNPAVAYSIGLVSGWLVIWTGVLFVVADPQADFRRVRRKPAGRVVERKETAANGRVTSLGTSADQTESSSVHRRPNRRPDQNEPSIGRVPQPAVEWQSFPDTPSWERFDWVTDLFFNFRGVGWSWRIDNLPPVPKAMQAELDVPPSSTFAKPAKYRKPDEASRLNDSKVLLRDTLWSVVRDYLVIDLIKTLGMHDSWFWSASAGPPPPFVPAQLHSSPVALQCIRLLLCVSALRTALEFTFTAGPLFFLGVMGPVIGVRGESWMYPDTFGSFDVVMEKGLPGWWSGWWHQLFRYGFDAPGRRLVGLLGWDRRGPHARFVQLCVAFLLSGFIHSCASAAQLGPSDPARPILFFLLQTCGVAGQLVVVAVARRVGIAQATPRWITRALNFGLVHVWLYFTAPILVQDIGAGGLWLYEPLPLSPMRGLGFGPKDHGGLVRWSGDVFWWHKGNHWWNTGLAV